MSGGGFLSEVDATGASRGKWLGDTYKDKEKFGSEGTLEKSFFFTQPHPHPTPARPPRSLPLIGEKRISEPRGEGCGGSGGGVGGRVNKPRPPLRSIATPGAPPSHGRERRGGGADDRGTRA